MICERCGAPATVRARWIVPAGQPEAGELLAEAAFCDACAETVAAPWIKVKK